METSQDHVINDWNCTVAYRYDPVNAVYYGIAKDSSAGQVASHQNKSLKLNPEMWSVITQTFEKNNRFFSPALSFEYPENVYYKTKEAFKIPLTVGLIPEDPRGWPSGKKSITTLSLDVSSSTKLNPKLFNMEIDVSTMLTSAVLLGARRISSSDYTIRFVYMIVGALIAESAPKAKVIVTCSHINDPDDQFDSLTLYLGVHCTAAFSMVKQHGPMATLHAEPEEIQPIRRRRKTFLRWVRNILSSQH